MGVFMFTAHHSEHDSLLFDSDSDQNAVIFYSI